jgi:hypothetical protein
MAEQNQTRCEEIGKACEPGQHVIDCATYRCTKCGAKYTAPHERVEVSGFRKVMIRGCGRDASRWAYGQQWRTPSVTEDGIRVAPHRQFYTDADARAVAEYVNQRVSP